MGQRQDKEFPHSALGQVFHLTAGLSLYRLNTGPERTGKCPMKNIKGGNMPAACVSLILICHKNTKEN